MNVHAPPCKQLKFNLRILCTRPQQHLYILCKINNKNVCLKKQQEGTLLTRATIDIIKSA